MRWLAASARTLMILLCAGVLVFGSAHATGTIIAALVCAPSGGSVITLNQPLSDSVVNMPDITVSGKVTQSGAVDISVDGIHRVTANVDSATGNFAAVVPVSQGTHEIRVTSQDICNAQNGLAGVVITYNPNATPSQGPRTPTVIVPARNTGDAAVRGDAVSIDSDQLQVWPENDMSYKDELVHGVIDESQPVAPVNATAGVIALPFVVGAGAFGWVHFRRLGH